MTESILKDVEEIARGAGALIMEMRASKRRVDFKSARDMVTEVDRASETFIVKTIRERYPDHSILAEEGGGTGETDALYRWIIDPLDGTTNFVHDFPIFAVSIGVEKAGQLYAGAVYHPVLDECFTAGLGQGAFLNGKQIHVSHTSKLGESILGTGFPYANNSFFELNMKLWASVYGKTQGLRRAGAAALDLAWVACGRMDGFWEFNMKPWDMAAGALLVTEAGGQVTDALGNKLDLDAGDLAAGNPRIHRQIIKEINDVLDWDIKGS